MNFQKSGKVNFIIFILIFIPVCLAGCGIYYGYPESQDEENTVEEVIDGDTFLLSSNQKVRLIGINTPEKKQFYYKEARQALKALIGGEKIKLEKDVSERDKYGRLLRYVYLDDLFVNLEMVKRGFANAFTYPPDVKYADEFLNAERFAREQGLGLWKKSEIDKIEISINYDAEGNDNNNLNGEYVLLKNYSNSKYNMDGWTVKDSATNIYRFGKYILYPGVCIYLYTGSGTDEGNKFYWQSDTPVWNNSHDTLYLRDKAGQLIGIYNY